MTVDMRMMRGDCLRGDRRSFTQFDDYDLQNGLRREVVGLEDARGRAIRVSHTRDGERIGFLILYPLMARSVSEAIQHARSGAIGRLDTGRTAPSRTGVSIVIWSRGGRVCFGRQNAEGQNIGCPTTFLPEHLAVLGDAIAWLVAP